MALRDCSAAISLNPKASKAYYRSALALTSLERFEEAIDVCQRCLKFDKGNQGIRNALQKATTLQAAKLKKERDRQAQIKREADEKDILRAGLLVGISINQLVMEVELFY